MDSIINSEMLKKRKKRELSRIDVLTSETFPFLRSKIHRVYYNSEMLEKRKKRELYKTLGKWQDATIH